MPNTTATDRYYINCNRYVRDERRKDPLDESDGQDTKKQLQESTDHGGAQHFAIGYGSLNSIIFHLRNGNFIYGQKGKACSHNGQDTTANVELTSKNGFGKGNGEFGNVDNGTNARRNQGGGNRVLLQIQASKAHAEFKNHQGRGHQSSHHGKGMLQSHDQR